jgi:hypothetical protein
MTVPLSKFVAVAFLAASAYDQTRSPKLYNEKRELSDLTDPAAVPADVAQAYDTILPWRALLLYDCGKAHSWCDDPSMSFRTVFGRAAGKAGLTDVTRALNDWKTSASDTMFENLFGKGNLNWSAKAPPFQLLAVVNRMDLAHWDDSSNTWEGAEVRFVYGLQPPAKALSAMPYTLILEFVAPGLQWDEFQTAAGAWRDTADFSDPKFLTSLNKALKASGLERSRYARLRTNRSLGGQWKMDEWLFKPGVKPFAAVPLEYQIPKALVDGPYASPPSTLQGLYLNLFSPSADRKVSSIRVPEELFTMSDGCVYGSTRGVCYGIDSGMPTPPGVCGVSPEARNIIALQQCTYCHTTETGTTFTHIGNHPRGTRPVISAFLNGGPLLEGSQVLRKPTIGELLNASDSKIFTSVKVTYETWLPDANGSCQQAPMVPANNAPYTMRRFYDLGRRALFLASVIAAPSHYSADAVTEIQKYSTDFSH